MSGASVDIFLDYQGPTVGMSSDDVLAELPAEERANATADTVIGLLKENDTKLRALREWELLADDDFTINVSFKAADGTVTRAAW